MASATDYRLVVRSDGDALLVTVEGGLGTAAGRHVREVADAAAKMGIPVRIAASEGAATAQFVTEGSHRIPPT
ncbi:MAG TPA: hypothetical protein VM345_10610 [Acidimicrobiales bacterium]|jgi:hypothetical protein|nr:hypothetical protein [Acidimicrobiales bacterium]